MEEPVPAEEERLPEVHVDVDDVKDVLLALDVVVDEAVDDEELPEASASKMLGAGALKICEVGLPQFGSPFGASPQQRHCDEVAFHATSPLFHFATQKVC